MITDTIQIKNFKCFDETGCKIDELKSINVIIGKNNSGKSSVIELFKFLIEKDKSFYETERKGNNPEIYIHHKMTRELIQKVFSDRMGGGPSPLNQYTNHFIYGLQFEGCDLVYKLDPTNRRKFISVDKKNLEPVIDNFQNYTNVIPDRFHEMLFNHLSAERDVLPEPASTDLSLSTTGIGAINYVQQILNSAYYNSDLIEKKLLGELNKIVNPDIDFQRILVQQIHSNTWEIYFESKADGKIPLSKMGSGVKTVLLVLIHLIVKPEIKKQVIDRCVFAFEELENNLHPSLQRRLYHYLYSFAQENNCTFILTTHSSVVIDLYNSLDDTQIFHVQSVNGKTAIDSTASTQQYHKIFDDLDVRASDILQSNGIIWVEGPSDRAYINKWISLLDYDLIEGSHYSICFMEGDFFHICHLTMILLIGS